MGLAKGSNWLFRSGVICACDCKILIGYWVQSIQEQCMMPAQPSVKQI